MLTITINHISVEVAEGTTVLQAAELLGITIPTMCYLHGYSNHPSCMVCLVKDLNTNHLLPSCALPVAEGMKISTNDSETLNARKEALELLMSDHVGDCEAPCRVTCPAFMNIPKMNRLIANNNFLEALKVVKEEIALPFTLGYICPAPCEKACRRAQLNEPVSICQLKKITALVDAQQKNIFFPEKQNPKNKKVAIIGAGAAGLAAAFYLLKYGYECVIFDKNEKAGGEMRYNIPDNVLPKQVLDNEIDIIKQFGAQFILNTEITPDFFENQLQKNFDATIFATGNYFGSNLELFPFKKTKFGIEVLKNSFAVNNSGVFACGNVVSVRKMAVNSVAQGKETALLVDMFLKQQTPLKPKPYFNSKFGKLFPSEIEEYKKETIDIQRIEKQQGKFDDFSTAEAIQEAKRCMNCDCRKADNCKLRILSNEYDVDRKRFSFSERKLLKKYFQHEEIVYEPEKCIKCNLCVDIAAKNSELVGLTAINRGFNVVIGVPFQKSLKEALQKTALLCAEKCPTGAISKKN